MTRKYFALLLLLFAYSLVLAQVKHANNVQYRVVTNSSGIHVRPFRFLIPQLYKDDNWRGKWIWLNKAAFPGYQRTSTLWLPDTSTGHKNYQALFRKAFRVATMPSSAVLFISGDAMFQVFVNGRQVGRGPVNIGSDYADNHSPDYWYYSSFDIRPYLKKGKNIIAAKVYSTTFEISATTSTKGQFICDLSLNDQPAVAYTDDSWKCNLDTSYNDNGPLLIYDANKEIKDWKEITYDDSQWAGATVNAAADTKKLFISQIPVPLDTFLNPVKFLSVKDVGLKEIVQSDFIKPQKGYHEFVLDVGKNMPAYISFRALAGKGDSIVVLPFEKLDYAPNRSFKFICRQGMNNYETPNLTPFRYLRVKLYAKYEMSIPSFGAHFSTYPVQYKGQFVCSNPFYNQLWNITRWSTQMCMNDMLYDSPLHQEPIGCTGDYFIESLNDYYAFGDAWLIRQNLVQTAQMLEKNDYKMFHTSYSLLWVQMLRQYYQYTGDKALVTKLMPHVQKLLERFHTYLDKDYIASNAPNYMFMDWITINHFNAHHPPAVIGMGYLTMMYYKALKDAMQMDSVVGENEKGRKNSALALNIKMGLNKVLWVKEKGLYKDGIPFRTSVKPGDWLPADKEMVTYSPQVNTLAVLYDIVPTSLQDTLMNYVVTQKDYQLQPYFMSYVLAAFSHTGQIDKGLKETDLWKNAIDTTTHTLKENWNDKTEYGYSGDYSHAWGGSPLLYLSKNILGISPGIAGYHLININLYWGDKISWAKGIVPVKNTSVLVNWKKTGNKSYLYQVRIPSNYKARVFLPREFQEWHLTINGEKIAVSSKPVSLLSGVYKISYHRN
jgi:alpha-L-rhamnosidase